MPDGVISTMEVRGVLFAVQIRKGSVDVEPVRRGSKGGPGSPDRTQATLFGSENIDRPDRKVWAP